MNKTMNINRAQSISSEINENEELLEIELHKLQRQYRIMEADRKAYSEESRILIGKQRFIKYNQRINIEKLKIDNKKLKESLNEFENKSKGRKRSGLRDKNMDNLTDSGGILIT